MTRYKATKVQAEREVAKMILARLSAIPGAKAYDVDRLDRFASDEGGETFGFPSVSWERSWAVGCDLSVDLPRNGRPAAVKVSWSGTGRTPLQAAAAARLYADVAVLAADIELLLAETEIAS